MSNVLFVNGTAHGHLNPTFPLVKELVKMGETVHYISTAEFKEKIESCGARFMDYGACLSSFLSTFKPTGSHPFFTLIEFLQCQNEIMSGIIMEKAHGIKFDYIIHDAMLGGGGIVSRQLGIPSVCTCTSFASNKLPVPPQMLARGYHAQLDNIYRQLDAARRNSGNDLQDIMDIFFQREGQNIVFTSRLFQPDGDSYGSSFAFVGPSIDDRGENGDDLPGRKTGERLVYISMGTINTNCAAFYKNCIEAFRGDDKIIVISTGKKMDPSELGEIPGNFYVRSYVPQLEVLKRASAFVSHGGLNSVSEALYFGVPIVAIPQANDQPMVARRLASLGAGIELRMEDATPQAIRDAVDQLTAGESYRTASQNIGDSFREAGGFKAAVDCIFSYKRKSGL